MTRNCTDLTPRTWTIYQLRNVQTGHLYIGQTCQTLNDRWKRHCSLAKAGHRSVLATSIREYGAETFEGLELIQVNTQAEADDWEVALIAAHPRARLYNEQLGGNSGVPLTAEAERKRHRAAQGCHSDPAWRSKVSEAQKRRWASYTPEQRALRGQQTSDGKKRRKDRAA